VMNLVSYFLSKTPVRRLPAAAAALAIAVALAVMSAAYHAANATGATAVSSKAASMSVASTKLRIRVGTRTLTATVAQNATARDFLSLLPLTVRMSDLFGREKAAPLPRALASGGRRRHTYSVGDIIYWSPGPDLAVYYRGGGPAIPAPGIVLLARLDSGTRAFNVPGAVRVRLERVRQR
jgi:hypothetical protein